MTRHDLSHPTRRALNAFVSSGTLDACDAMELGAECSTPLELLDALVEVLAARQHEPGREGRRELCSLVDAAYAAERAAA